MESSTDFSNIWDYDNPQQTRSKFEKLLNGLDHTSSKRLEVITQIARTYGLEQEFEKGHNILNNHIADLEHSTSVPKARYHLERGRLYNSDNNKAEALVEFHEAWNIASNHNIHYLAIDAAHMIAIAEEDLHEQIHWNLKAINYAEQSTDELSRKWLGSLYNNTGWNYHDLQQYDKALELFEKALLFYESEKNKKAIRIAKWTIGRVYRSMERFSEALEIMNALYREQQKSDNIEASGYVVEELGELYLEKGKDDKAAKYFTKAFKILSKNKHLLVNQPERLQRIKELSTIN